MKKLALASALALTLLAPSAFANTAVQSGKVTFSGKVIDTTCYVKTDDQNKTVTLPSVAKSAFTKKGDVAGQTAFEITITGCTNVATGSNQGGVHWLVDANVDVTTGTLKNTLTSGQATNVNLQLVDANLKTIKIGATDDVSNINYVALQNNQDKTVRFYAQYYATDTGVTAGDVQAIAKFELVYK
ncbi:fimbrial protein [Psittacicella hinzii]|nr:fimbrial protein [Psittacicella hinzii]